MGVPMDQRVSFNEGDSPYSAMTAEVENWMPPVAPLLMPRQTLERRPHRAGLFELTRTFLLRRKA